MSTPTPTQLRRNVRVTLVLSFFQMFMVLMPVIVLFFESRGLSMSQVLLLQAWFAALVLLLEVPSGYIADLLGRKRTLIAGTFFGAVGHSLLVFMEGFWQLAVFEACLAVGFSLISGADLAFLYDTEVALRDPTDKRRKSVARLFATRNLSEGLAAGMCSVLLLWSMDAAVYAQAGFAWVAFGLTFALVEPPVERLPHGGHIANLAFVARRLLANGAILRLTVLALAIWPLTTMFAVWLLQRHWQGQGIDIGLFGYLWGGLTLIAALAGKYALALEDRLGSTIMLLVIGIAPAVAYCGLAAFGVVGGLVVATAFFACRGFGIVILRQALNKRVSSEFRATANSFASLGFRGAFAVTAPLVGAVLDWWGMGIVFLSLAAASLAICVALIAPLILAARSARTRVQVAVPQVSERASPALGAPGG